MQTFLLSKYAGVLGLAFLLPVATIQAFEVTKLSSYAEECGGQESCTEIAAYDAVSSRIFVTNAAENELRILDVVDGQLLEAEAIDLSLYGGGPNSVAVSNGTVAVAVEASDKQANGTVELFMTDGTHIDSVEVGALPDMLTFTPDGKFLLVANEGEPNADYSVDPEGSVSVIDTASWTARTAGFNSFTMKDLKDVRIFGPGASIAQDLEPEYVTVAEDSKTAWISLQENNAMARLDIETATITAIYGLGYKKHQQQKNAFDASNKDNGINIQPWPVYGMYQPDALAAYQRGNATFIISANEGDARDYDGFSEEARVKDLALDPDAFPDAEVLQEDENLGRLKTTLAHGDIDGDGDFDQIFAYGGRSFSIWNANGNQVYDSGSTFERSLAQYQQQGMDVWNDSRSDDKGPEPESVTVGTLGDSTYAFIGLERTSAIFVYQLDNPYKPVPAGFINTKQQGDIGPEGLVFIERDSNTGWLLVTNEISNTISLYEIKP